MPYSDAFKARFFSQVEKGDGCWPWQGVLSQWGYGRVYVARDDRRIASRVALEIELGRPIRKGMFACHECNNPACCRVGPGHIYEGTPKQNSADRERAGRGTMQIPKGEAHPSAKITEDDVRYIRQAWAMGVSQKELRIKFGLSSSAVCLIIQKKKWPHVE